MCPGLAPILVGEYGPDIVEFPRRPENRELRRAIEKWGVIERPKTPWLRVAPRLHPHKMTFEEQG